MNFSFGQNRNFWKYTPSDSHGLCLHCSNCFSFYSADGQTRLIAIPTPALLLDKSSTRTIWNSETSIDIRYTHFRYPPKPKVCRKCYNLHFRRRNRNSVDFYLMLLIFWLAQLRPKIAVLVARRKWLRPRCWQFLSRRDWDICWFSSVIVEFNNDVYLIRKRRH